MSLVLVKKGAEEIPGFGPGDWNILEVVVRTLKGVSDAFAQDVFDLKNSLLDFDWILMDFVMDFVCISWTILDHLGPCVDRFAS
jgi:hypothetical protein